MNELIDVGVIKLSDRAVVSDPCYDRSTWCMLTGVPVMPGEYKVYALLARKATERPRVAGIICYHCNSFTDLEQVVKQKWTKYDDFGVDSGQAGIFDDSIYPVSKDARGEYDDTSSFYGECCHITLHSSCECLASGKGIVTSSGYGDGFYRLRVIKQRELCCAMLLDFEIMSLIPALKNCVKQEDCKNDI